jgi:outer membrane protein assembly factor BamE (lipoprotein component of BamABCDE complex)
MRIFNYIIIFLIFENCTLNNTINHHGVHFLEKKEKKLLLNKSNKNDIIKLLGSPSTKSSFNNLLWIYIERKNSSTLIKSLGNKNLIVNNVLILEINQSGMLVKKNFLTKEDMKKIKFAEDVTGSDINQQKFIYKTLSSMRQRINDPLGKKRKRISED